MDAELTEVAALPELPAREHSAHKNNCGRVLVIAGSGGMCGAGMLAANSALRSGAGIVTWALAQSLSVHADFACPEVIILPIPHTAQHSPALAAREHLLEAAREAQAVIIGPGLPVAGETGELIRLLVPEISSPLLIDAGALRAISGDVQLIAKRTAPTVLTPHPGEMSQLCGLQVSQLQEDRTGTAARYAAESGAVVLLKGPGTVISDGRRVRINTTGNPALATAGSGDVLSGVIAALLAQGLAAFEAACLGAHLHGAAGDIARERGGLHGVIAGDVAACLPGAFMAYRPGKV